MKASRTVCGKCGARVIRADCFDGRARTFDLTPVAGADAVGHGHPASRWWFTRSAGMVNGSLADHGPSSWHVRHPRGAPPRRSRPSLRRWGPVRGPLRARCSPGARSGTGGRRARRTSRRQGSWVSAGPVSSTGRPCGRRNVRWPCRRARRAGGATTPRRHPNGRSRRPPPHAAPQEWAPPRPAHRSPSPTTRLPHLRVVKVDTDGGATLW